MEAEKFASNYAYLVINHKIRFELRHCNNFGTNEKLYARVIFPFNHVIGNMYWSLAEIKFRRWRWVKFFAMIFMLFSAKTAA